MISLPVIIAIISSVVFGLLAIIYSLKEDKAKRLLKDREKIFQHRLYEATVLKEIQERIGYSLDTEKICDIIISSLDNIFPYSTASSLIVKNGRLTFNTKIKEPVSKNFLTQVKSDMLKSLTPLLKEPLPENVAGTPKIADEKITGIPLDENSNQTPSSSFNTPLMVNKKIQGIINISSIQPDLYKEEQIAILVKITDLANNVLTRLDDILTKEKNKLIGLIGNFEEGVVMIDPNYQISTINKHAIELLSLQSDKPTIIDLLSHLPNTYNFGDKIEKAIKLNQKIEEKDVQHNGILLNITINPILEDALNQESKVIGASFIMHDNTHEKRLYKMKDDFTRIIVHELRSPLTSIKASSEMLNSVTNLNDEEKKRLINIIHSQTDKMLDEVSMILDAAKIETGIFTVNKNNTDLHNILEEIIESFRNTAQNKMINLTSNIDSSLPALEIDAYQIRRVINNLLSNSIKFTPGGGTINLKAWLTPEKVFISVSDTGNGIPKEKQHLIFTKFAQIENANATVGTGLGLFISNGIIQAHNGTIAFESEQGKGTTFTISLPLTSSKSLSPVEGPTTPVSPLTPTPHLPN